ADDQGREGGFLCRSDLWRQPRHGRVADDRVPAGALQLISTGSTVTTSAFRFRPSASRAAWTGRRKAGEETPWRASFQRRTLSSSVSAGPDRSLPMNSP